LRRFLTLGLTVALAGCAPSWLPFIGRDEPEPSSTASTADASAEAPPHEAGCPRKGRLWPEGSRVCEDHRVTRCFADGGWHVIGSC